MIKLWLKETVKEYKAIHNGKDIADQMVMLRNADQETLWVLGFTSSNKTIIQECVFKGTIDSSMCDPILIFKRLLNAGAVNFAIVHNHPSGNIQPSKDDEIITRKIAKIAGFLGFTMYDHIIIADEGYYSFSANTSIISEGIGEGKKI